MVNNFHALLNFSLIFFCAGMCTYLSGVLLLVQPVQTAIIASSKYFMQSYFAGDRLDFVHSQVFINLQHISRALVCVCCFVKD